MTLKDKKVLIVEDDSFLAGIVLQKLSGAEWQTLYAENGPAALETVQQEHPNLILLDILLPNMDGLEVLEKLKSDPASKDIPVLMFTNVDDKDRVARAKELGADGFFVKANVDLDSMVVEIKRRLEH